MRRESSETMSDKTIRLSRKGRGPKRLQIEADGCTVLVDSDVVDEHGNDVTYISVTADGDRFAGNPEWWVAPGSKVTPSGVGLRVVMKARRKSRGGKRSSRR
jgi:hypothetical protein